MAQLFFSIIRYYYYDYHYYYNNNYYYYNHYYDYSNDYFFFFLLFLSVNDSNNIHLIIELALLRRQHKINCIFSFIFDSVCGCFFFLRTRISTGRLTSEWYYSRRPQPAIFSYLFIFFFRLFCKFLTIVYCVVLLNKFFFLFDNF